MVPAFSLLRNVLASSALNAPLILFPLDLMRSSSISIPTSKYVLLSDLTRQLVEAKEM
jgi:hypothetical protein